MRYTSLLEPMSFPLSRRCSIFLLAAFLAVSASAQNEPETPWVKPAHDLVQKLLDRAADPASVSFEVENRAGLPAAQVQQIRKLIDEQFRAAKVKVVRMEAAVAEVRFILARNARGLLWIAQVKQGPSEHVSMLEFADPTGADYANKPALFQLQKELLLARPGIILDVAVLDDSLLVLGSDQISLYRRGALTGTAQATAAILHSSPWPRDLRGRILTNGDAFAAYLPGVHCSGTLRPSFAAQCRESDDPWPLLREGAQEAAAFFGGARNHFSGVLGGTLAGITVPPFFSAARLGDVESAMWAFAGTDGSTRFYLQPGQPVRTVTSLGSDLAAVQSPCGAHWQLLVSGDGDDTVPDVLQAFEIRNREAAPVSEKLALSGPVKALWSAADRTHAIAIVRDAGKEVYEAYRITVTCR